MNEKIQKSEYKKSAQVKIKLLDTAEELFAERGFFGVSIRDITDRATLRSASINYHFGTKENLFLQIINRRIEPLAQARLEKLALINLDVDDKELNTHLLVEAFAEPMLDFSLNGGAGWRNYCILIAKLAVQKIWSENSVSEKYDSHAQEFLTSLREIFPEADDYKIHCAFQFMLSVTLYAVCGNQRIDTLSMGDYKSENFNEIQTPLFDFITAGIMRVCQ